MGFREWVSGEAFGRFNHSVKDMDIGVIVHRNDL